MIDVVINSTEWTLVILNFPVENYAINIIYDEMDSAHADMCLSNSTMTHSVYLNTHNCKYTQV